MDDNLFSTRYLNIVYHGREFTGPWEDIFLSPEYVRFDAVTYVSTAKFFFEFAQNFTHVSLILGIDKSEAHINFDPIAGIEFFNHLEPAIKERVLNESIKIRHFKDKIIHSKLYLLRDVRDRVVRVIMGSANFTQHALGGRQFEELLVFDRADDPDICDVYDRRYQELVRNTSNLVPDDVMKKFKAGLPPDSDEVRSAAIQAYADHLIGSDANDVFHAIEEEEQRHEIEYRVKEKDVFRLFTKKSDTGYAFKKINDRQINKIKDVIATRYRDTPRVAPVVQPTYEKGLFYQDEDSVLIEKDHDGTASPFPLHLSNEQLIQRIEVLDRVINAYDVFIKGNREEKLENKQKVFEIILYAFMSPFIWKLRDNYLEIKKPIVDIPLFLIISGASRTGKTSLVTMINILLGKFKDITDYSKNNGIIKDRLNFEDLYPVLVDEVARDFFSQRGTVNTGRGEEFIVQMCNSLGNTEKRKYPAVIVTTNIDNVEERLLRRVYDIKLSGQFDTDTGKRAEAEHYKNTLRTELNGDLFRDFSHRLIQNIKSGFSSSDFENDDFLLPGRRIFKKWFDEIGQEPYDWYNEKREVDYYKRGSKRWKDLYDYHYKYFQKQKDRLLLSNSVFKSKKEIDQYINYLPSGILKDSSGVITSLDKKEFFNFIGEKEGFLRFIHKG